MKKVNLEIYKGMAEIEQSISISEWKTIFLLSSNATVYNHPSFVLNWFKTLSYLRGNLPILIKGDIRNRTIILPMELYRIPRGFYKFNVLYGIGGPYNIDFQDPLISGEIMTPPEIKEVWDEVFRLIRCEMPECDQVIIPRLRTSAATDLRNCDQSTVSPYIDLSSHQNLDDVLARCRASHRGDVKRQIRRLGQIGALTMRIFRPIEKEDAQEELSRFFKAYECQWNPEEKHKDELKETQKFLGYLIDDILETGLIHFSVLKCGGDSIHWHYGFLHNNRLHYYKPTYDVSWSNYSPGKVHVAYLIEHCIKNGTRYFDFLYGDEPYKYHWAPTDEKLYRLKKWNGLRPTRRFIEELIKPTYRYVKRLI